MATTYKAPGVYVEQVPSGSAPITGVGTSTAGFIGVFGNSVKVINPEFKPTAPVSDTNSKTVAFTVLPAGEVQLVTNFTEFKKFFGDFSNDDAAPGHAEFAHAVYGFFLNGGTRCYVTRVLPSTAEKTDWRETSIASALKLFEAIDEIAIVAAPGISGGTPYADLVSHCELLGTRVAVADPQEKYGTEGTLNAAVTALEGISASNSVALYFPWIQVHDPATEKLRFVPPSGHIAGIYARVDAQRGVHKAPANEKILGAQGIKYAISQRHQEGLNEKGVNCIRKMNGNIKVWGARTVGGDTNLEFKYLNVRRVFNYLRASLDQGTQWAVFEPNTPDLWAKITRNVSAFLTTVWNSGALFGDKAEDAFYVKCDAETNPPESREQGKVVTEIGVAITRPAEFVIIRLGQKSAK